MFDYIAANFWPLFAAAVIGAAAMHLIWQRRVPAMEVGAEKIMIDLLGDNARLQHDNRALRAAAQMAVTDGGDLDAALLALRNKPQVKLAGPDAEREEVA